MNLGTIICLFAVTYLIYFLLANDRLIPFSMCTTDSHRNDLHGIKHLFFIGIMPIYLGFIIFGTAIFAKYIGTLLQRWATHFLSGK